MEDGHNALNGRIDDVRDVLTARVDGLNARIEILAARIEALNERIDGVHSRIDGLERRLDRLESRQENLEQSVAELRSEIAGELGYIKGLIHSLNERLTLMARHHHDESSGRAALAPDEIIPD